MNYQQQKIKTLSYRRLVKQATYAQTSTKENSHLFQNPRIQTMLNLCEQDTNIVTFNSGSKQQRLSNHSRYRSCLNSIHKKGTQNKSNSKPSRQCKQTFRSYVKTRRTYRCSKQREKFIHFKQDLEQLLLQIQGDANKINMARFLQIKQNIMLNFFNLYIQEISRENMDKAELLVILWNNTFLLLEKALQKICQHSRINQYIGIRQQIDMHEKYQKILSQNMEQKKKIMEQNEKKQKFMKILIAKLRQYKKCIKKLQQNLRIAADKLNQFRKGYLQIQIQCINMTMEYKNLGQQSASLMIKRKMALIMQKSKQYKILPSKKKTKLYMKSLKIDAQNSENEQIKKQIVDACESNLNEKPEVFTKTVGRTIEAILDKQQSQPIDYSIFNQNLIQNKYLVQQLMVDKQTDMCGFCIQKEDKKVGVNHHQLIYYQMSKTKGVQTLPIQKPHIPKTHDVSFQCDNKTIKLYRFQQNRTFDLSFLFQNTNKSSVFKRQQPLIRPMTMIQTTKNKKIIQRQFQINKNIQQTHSQMSQLQNEIQKSKDRENNPSSKLSSQQNIQQDNKEIQIESNKYSSDAHELVGSFDVKRRIKKLASTLNNKASFLNNFNHQKHRRYTKGDFSFQDTKQFNESKGEQTQTQLLCIQEDSEANAQNQKKVKPIKKLKNQQYQQKSKDSKKLQKYSQQMIKRNTKSSHHRSRGKINDEVITKSISSRKNNIKPENYNRNNKAPTNIKNLNDKSLLGHKNTNKKQYDINHSQIYKDISHQIAKAKPQVAKQSKNLNKIKQLEKNIQSILQCAQKDHQSGLKLSTLIQYVFQSINNKNGFINNLYIKKKAIIFIKDVFYLQEKSSIFRLFCLMIGINEQGQQNQYFCHKNNEVFIKLCSKLYLNWKCPLKISQLNLNQVKIDQNIEFALKQQGFCNYFINNLVKTISDRYLFNKNHTSQPLDVILDIYNELLNQQKILIISYQPIFNLIKDSSCNDFEDQLSQSLPKQLVQMIIQLHFFKLQQKLKSKNKFKTFCQENDLHGKLNKGCFAFICFQLGLLDFSHLFYKSLSIFHIKQNQTKLRQISTRMSSKVEIPGIDKQMTKNIIDNCGQMKGDLEFDGIIKVNLLLLLYLKTLDCQVASVLQEMMGQNMAFMYRHASQI